MHKMPLIKGAYIGPAGFEPTTFGSKALVSGIVFLPERGVIPIRNKERNFQVVAGISKRQTVQFFLSLDQYLEDLKFTKQGTRSMIANL